MSSRQKSRNESERQKRGRETSEGKKKKQKKEGRDLLMPGRSGSCRGGSEGGKIRWETQRGKKVLLIQGEKKRIS